jgi:hypothetical protein
MNGLGSTGKVAALALALTLVPAAAAQARTVSCGEVITQDTTVSNDLDCVGDALSVGADDVTLNLNGHEIQARIGPTTSAGVTAIRSRDHDGVVIRNGVAAATGLGNVVVVSGSYTAWSGFRRLATWASTSRDLPTCSSAARAARASSRVTTAG